MSSNCVFWFLQTIICICILTSYPIVRKGERIRESSYSHLLPSLPITCFTWGRQVDVYKCLCLQLSLKARFDCIGLYYDFRVIFISNELPRLCSESESYVHSPLQRKNQNKFICSTYHSPFYLRGSLWW